MARKKTPAQLDREINEVVPGWARGLDLSESRRLAESIRHSQEAETARRQKSRERFEREERERPAPQATLTRRIPFPGSRGGPLVISTAKWTGEANRAHAAIVAAKLHVWDTGPGKVEVAAGQDYESVKRRVITALEGVGFIINDETP